MIIMPHIDGCTIVTESWFCSVMGHPYDRCQEKTAQKR